MKEKDRLSELEELFRRRKRQKSQLCWVTYNSNADYQYDIHDAGEDFAWMVYEIKQLRQENSSLKEFVYEFKKDLQRDLDLPDKEK